MKKSIRIALISSLMLTSILADAKIPDNTGTRRRLTDMATAAKIPAARIDDVVTQIIRESDGSQSLSLRNPAAIVARMKQIAPPTPESIAVATTATASGALTAEQRRVLEEEKRTAAAVIDHRIRTTDIAVKEDSDFTAPERAELERRLREAGVKDPTAYVAEARDTLVKRLGEALAKATQYKDEALEQMRELVERINASYEQQVRDRGALPANRADLIAFSQRYIALHQEYVREIEAIRRGFEIKMAELPGDLAEPRERDRYTPMYTEANTAFMSAGNLMHIRGLADRVFFDSDFIGEELPVDVQNWGQRIPYALSTFRTDLSTGDVNRRDLPYAPNFNNRAVHDGELPETYIRIYEINPDGTAIYGIYEIHPDLDTTRYGYVGLSGSISADNVREIERQTRKEVKVGDGYYTTKIPLAAAGRNLQEFPVSGQPFRLATRDITNPDGRFGDVGTARMP